MEPTLYLLTGLPGAGKTTAAKAIEKVTGATRLTSDEVRHQLWKEPTLSEPEHQKLYKILNKQTEQLLKFNKSVIYDANLNRFIHRKEKYDLAKNLHLRTVLIWVKTPHELARSRRVTQTEHHHLVPKHETPATMFDRVAGVFEPPGDHEPYLAIDGTNITDSTIKQLLGTNSK